MVKKFVPVLGASIDGSAELAALIEAGTRQTSAFSFGSNQDPLVPGGAASFARATWVPLDPTDDDLEIAGIDSSEVGEVHFVRLKVLFNSTPDKIMHLLDNSATTVADRILIPSGGRISLGPLSCVVIYYSEEVARWLIVAMGSALDSIWTANLSVMVRDTSGNYQNISFADKTMLARWDALGASDMAALTRSQLAHLQKESGTRTDTTTSGTDDDFASASLDRQAWLMRLQPTGLLRIQGINDGGLVTPFDSALERVFVNDGTAASMVVFEHLAGSTAPRDIITPDGLDYWLRPGEACTIVRDSVEAKWRVREPSRTHDQTFRFAVQTTDATVTTCGQLSTHTNERAISLRVTIIGRQLTTDDTCKYVIEAIVNRAAGGGLSIKNQTEVYTFEDQAWNGVLDVTGSDIRARVTGEAAKTIEWETAWEVMEHG